MDKMKSNYKHSFELMIGMTLLLGHIAFCNTIPHILYEVDPTLVLKPGIAGILRDIIMHEGCSQPIDESLICTHNRIAEIFHEKSSSLTDGDRQNASHRAILIALSSIMISIMLNAAIASDITQILVLIKDKD